MFAESATNYPISSRRGRTGAFILALTLTGLGGCGDGDGDRGPIRVVPGTPTQSAATVDGFGSIFVNGVEWDTDTAVFLVDDQPGSETDLDVGEFVVVSGVLDPTGLTATADTVGRDPLLRGEITAIDLAAELLTILNHTIEIDTDSLFAPPLVELANLSVGDVVEVDGLFSADSDVLATLIQVPLPGQPSEIRGIVTGLNSASNKFMLAGLAVDAATAAFEDFNANIANGNVVEVQGSLFDASGAIIAERVQFESASAGMEFEPGGRSELLFQLEGLITSFTNSTDFAVSGVRISTSQATRYENGSSQDLGRDVRVRIAGGVDADGRFIADDIEFTLVSDLLIAATVEDVALTGDSVSVLGVDVATTSTTKLIDASDARVRRFALDDLAIGDYVEIRAIGGSDPVRANLLMRSNPGIDLRIAGSVTSVDDPELSVDGALVQTDADTIFRDRFGATIPATDFFVAARVGSQVRANGQSPSDGVLLADGIQID